MARRIVGRMLLVMTLLWGVVLAFLVVATEVAGIAFWVAPAIVLVLVFLQWALGPVVIRWIYDIEWVGPDHWGGATERMIRDVVTRHDVPMPRFGVVHDDNPNAFAFGWTKRRAHVVVTDGVPRYCDDEETRAVIAHELGHVVHNDFVVMTAMAAVPTLFYVAGRFLIELGDSGKKAGGYAAMLGFAAMVLYYVSTFGVLLVNRHREYYADEFAADVVHPNALSRALVTISYGLAREVGRTADRDERSVHAKWESALMFQSPREGTSIAARAHVEEGEIAEETIERTMSWDLWNPWAFWWEIHSSHPLTAKRIRHLDDLAEAQGSTPHIDFDREQPESFLDEFLVDLAAKHGPWIVALVAFVLALWTNLLGPIWIPGVAGDPVVSSSNVDAGAMFLAFVRSLGLGLAILGAGYTWYTVFYHRPTGFRRTRVADILPDPKAGPIRGKPVELEGRIIGRGEPGLWWSEDVKIHDGSAMVLVDYHQLSNVVDFFVGILETEDWVDEDVVVRGWYRRYGVPWIELYQMEIQGQTKTMYNRGLTWGLSLVAAVVGVGLVALPYLPIPV